MYVPCTGLPISKGIILKDHSFKNIEVTLLDSNFGSTRKQEFESYSVYKFNTIKNGINKHPG